MRSYRRMVSGSALALGTLLAVALPAWACTSAPTLNSLSPQVGTPRNVVTLSGTSFPKAPVEIRWSAVTGPLLATAASGPTFGVDVMIPEAASPGVHFLLAITRDADGRIGAKATVPFEVADPGANGLRPIPNSGWGGGTGPKSGSSTGSVAPLVMGVALLAGGSVVLLSGFGVVAVKRRQRAVLHAR